MAISSTKDHVSFIPSGGNVSGRLERINPDNSVFVASLILDGSGKMIHSLVTIDMTTILALMYLAFVATIVGYGIWGTLLGRYETWRVAPLSLLVPVVGLASAALLLDERLTGLQFLGAVLIMAGLYINVFGLQWRKAVKVRG